MHELRRLMRTLGLIILFVLLPLTSNAQEVEQFEEERSNFVVGNIVFVLLHEFGHLIIDDFGIPILGNSEDAADTLAAVTLIRLDRAHPETDFAYIRMLLSAADANRILWQKGFERDNLAFYADRHPLSVQRVARVACLVYGSDMETFELLPGIIQMPDARADWCDEEYANADNGWQWVRDTYIPKTTSTELNHQVKYGSTRDPAQLKIKELMQQHEVLEKALQAIQDTILLPATITLRTRSCGSPNAYWDPNSRDLVLCYELVDGFYKLSSEQKIVELEQRMREFDRAH